MVQLSEQTLTPLERLAWLVKLVKAEPFSVHVHQVSDVRHVQPRGGAGGLHGDHRGGKEGGHGGPQHWAQGLGPHRALVVVTIRRWGRHLKSSLGQTKTQSQQLSSTLAILRSLKHQICESSSLRPHWLTLYSVRRVNDSSHWYRQNHKSVQCFMTVLTRLEDEDSE